MFSDPSALILLLCLIAGTVLAALGLPLYFGKVPPNRYYGFRTRSTLGNRQLWYAVNRATGAGLVLTAAVMVGVATWLAWQGFDIGEAARVDLTVFVCGTLLTIVHATFVFYRDR